MTKQKYNRDTDKTRKVRDKKEMRHGEDRHRQCRYNRQGMHARDKTETRQIQDRDKTEARQNRDNAYTRQR